MKIKYTHKWFRKNADKLNQWFDPELFDWDYKHYLPKYCIDYIDVWYDPEYFNRSKRQLRLERL